MHVVVAGASGYIGGHVVAELVARGHEVTALLRRAPDASQHSRLAGARTICVDVADTKALAAAVFEPLRVDAVVSCLAARGGRPDLAWQVDYGAQRALLGAARHGGAVYFQSLSALCVQTPRLAFQRAKLAFEQVLSETDIGWSIIRPTAFFKSLAGQVERVRAGAPFLLFGGGSGPACLPISQADTARFMVDTLEVGRHGEILPIGGPGPAVTPYERGLSLFVRARRTPRFRRIPIALLHGVEKTAAATAPISTRGAHVAEFARIARFYATEPMLARDTDTGRHSAAATPRYGHDTLAAFYDRIWAEGLDGQQLGEAALFDRSRSNTGP